jgi:hypothetical protein
MATTFPVWALVCERGCTPYMVQVEPRKGTRSAVTRQRSPSLAGPDNPATPCTPTVPLTLRSVLVYSVAEESRDWVHHYGDREG